MRATATNDYAPWEVGLAIFVALAIEAAGGAVLYFGQNHNLANLDEIDKKHEQPVRVKPVLDLDGEALKLGGKKPILPDMWQAPKPQAAAPPKATDQTFASTKADETETPEKKRQMADAGTTPPDDAGTRDEAPDAGQNDSDAGPGDPDTKPEGNKDEGDKDGTKNGTQADKLKASAIATYQSRLSSFFQRFAPCNGVNGSAPATATLSGTTVTGVSVGSSGDAGFDAAIPGGMKAAVGQSVPPPPEDYPDLLGGAVSFTVRCGSGGSAAPKPATPAAPPGDAPKPEAPPAGPPAAEPPKAPDPPAQ